MFGLGGVLYHLLTGIPPNDRGVPRPDPPGPRAAAGWVDEGLDAITRRALAFEPADRYATAGELAADLERWLADQPIAAQRAAVARLAALVDRDPTALGLAEQLGRQRTHLGLMYGGMGRDAEAADELGRAASLFSYLANARGEPRLLAEEANCRLALARALDAVGRDDEAAAEHGKAAQIYAGLIVASPDEYRANYADIMVTIAGYRVPPPAPDAVGRAGPPAGPAGGVGADGTGPQQFGGFRLIRELGGGRATSVVLARDNDLDRLVAIKEVRADAGADGQFAREIWITAGLDHPNIVRVHGTGRRGRDNRPFLILEYLPGREFVRVIEEAGPGWGPAALDPIAQLCDGLEYSHARGVVHLDPKPANIMVLESGRAVLFDWGLAEVVDQLDWQDEDPDGVPRGILEAGGLPVGTPAYMAPEQARGDRSACSPRTDVYVAGVGLYHALTGRTQASGVDVAGTILAVAAGDVPGVREVRPDVPAAIAAVCDKAMAFRPEDRYPTAATLAADVRAFLAGRPVSVARRRRFWQLFR